MTTNHVPAQTLGDLVAASYERGQALSQDSIAAAELAARHLERVLVRGSNLRVSAALARLAREIAPKRAAATSPRSFAVAAAR